MEHKLPSAKPDQSFSKEERLYSRKQIEELFQKSSHFYLYPFKVFYRQVEQAKAKHSILISVPKRNFKSAVQRNGIKRQIREAYRTQKHILPEDNTRTLQIAYIYTAKQKMSTLVVHTKLLKTLHRLMKEVTEISK